MRRAGCLPRHWLTPERLCSVCAARAVRVVYRGKHTKKITCGSWNRQNKLALGSEDKQVTISDKEGDNLETLSVKSPPSQLAFNEQKTDDSSVETVSVRPLTLSFPFPLSLSF